MSAWAVAIDGIEQGLVTRVDMTATRKCGRTESLTAYQFPAGWRMTANNVPQAVRLQAIRHAREVWQ